MMAASAASPGDHPATELSVRGPETLVPGTRFGRYAVVRPLAAGGMSELYLATPVDGSPRAIALKRLLPHLAWDPEFVRMFLDEVRIVAGLDHPNIVRVLDFGLGDGGHFFAMEYLHGSTIREIVRQWSGPGPIPRSVAVGIVLEVAAGLDYAHRHTDMQGEPAPIVHRDVSPSNVILTHDGSVKLVDFGIAKVAAQTRNTRAGTIKGKIGYMSPEQCRGESVDHRSDVFGLGIMLYELTVHRRAFYADNDYGVMNRIIEGRFAPPSAVVADYPEELEAIVIRALHVDPGRRYPSVAALSEDLSRFAAHCELDVSVGRRRAFVQRLFGNPPLPSLAIPSTQPRLSLDSPQRRLGGPTLVIGFMVGGLGFALGGWWMSETETETESEAEPISVVGEPSMVSEAATAEPPVDPRPPVDRDDASETGLEPPSEPLVSDSKLAPTRSDPGVSAAAVRPRRASRVRQRSKQPPASQERPPASDGDRDRTLLPPSWQ
jgi:serine/threonine protein kinase